MRSTAYTKRLMWLQNEARCTLPQKLLRCTVHVQSAYKVGVRGRVLFTSTTAMRNWWLKCQNVSAPSVADGIQLDLTVHVVDISDKSTDWIRLNKLEVALLVVLRARFSTAPASYIMLCTGSRQISRIGPKDKMIRPGKRERWSVLSSYQGITYWFICHARYLAQRMTFCKKFTLSSPVQILKQWAGKLLTGIISATL